MTQNLMEVKIEEEAETTLAKASHSKGWRLLSERQRILLMEGFFEDVQHSEEIYPCNDSQIDKRALRELAFLTIETYNHKLPDKPIDVYSGLQHEILATALADAYLVCINPQPNAVCHFK